MTYCILGIQQFSCPFRSFLISLTSPHGPNLNIVSQEKFLFLHIPLLFSSDRLKGACYGLYLMHQTYSCPSSIFDFLNSVKHDAKVVSFRHKSTRNVIWLPKSNRSCRRLSSTSIGRQIESQAYVTG